ncbi:hypothetical protein F5Y01DRAFT_322804 [Xylaria sp. FL0043]|nr:hypothetical protein F5Y01DRAFT_322804 [Xylaria sp. FL0043]
MLPGEVHDHQPPVTGAVKMEAILGGILGGVIILLSLAFCYVLRRNKMNRIQAELARRVVLEEPRKHTGKPELEGSKAYVYTTKPEMDANATRAELEGGHVEDRGDGIYVWKPELEGTPGTERHRGAHVRKKSELGNLVGNMHFCRTTEPNESEAISGS